jgi:Predicted metal binding domain
MRLDPRVGREKYDRELARLSEQRRTLETRGIFLLGSSTYPVVELFFAPRHPLRVAVPALQTGSGVVLPQNTFMIAEVPGLAARSFKARFDLTDFDLRAPSVDFRDPWTDEILAYETMFRALEFEKDRKAHVVILPDHPHTHKPFLCLRGIREYHEHPQHSGDDWLLYRGSMNLFSIVMSLWRVSVDLIHAHLAVQPNNLQVQWVTEEKL